MRAKSIRSHLAGVAYTFAMPMLLAAFAGGCSADATTSGGPSAQGESPAATVEEGSASNPGGETPAPQPAPNPGPGGEVTPPPATVGRIVGYAYQNAPAADQSTPSANLTFNASGGAVGITRLGTGKYAVDFAGLTLDKSVALVSAYADASTICTWMSTTGSAVNVSCFMGGNYADARFVVTLVDEGAPTDVGILGFAHANDKSAASYAPTRSNNAVGGGAITATRSATGVYRMHFGGLAIGDIRNVQITPYGSETARCVIDVWIGPDVDVRCFGSNDSPVDAQYSIFVAGKKPGATARISAFAHAADATAVSYEPALLFNEAKGAATAIRSDVGAYSMVFDDLDLDAGGIVQVTTHDSGRRCNVSASAGTASNVTCSTSDGSLMNSKYAIVVVK
jgi:hypothetical protein